MLGDRPEGWKVAGTSDTKDEESRVLITVKKRSAIEIDGSRLGLERKQAVDEIDKLAI